MQIGGSTPFILDMGNIAAGWIAATRAMFDHPAMGDVNPVRENADSIIVASEPLTKDTSAWVELPEYGALYAEVRGGRPRVSVRLLD